MSADLIYQLSAQCSGISSKKGDRSCGNDLKRQEKMDRYLGENVSFLGFSGKKLA
ncbi:hypothetical protein AAAU20_04150 [Faecalibacterium prausnitzii]